MKTALVFVFSDVICICDNNRKHTEFRVQRSVSEALTSSRKSLSIITGFSFSSETGRGRTELMYSPTVFLNEVPGWYMWTGIFLPVTALLLLFIAYLSWRIRKSKRSTDQLNRDASAAVI